MNSSRVKCATEAILEMGVLCLLMENGHEAFTVLILLI